MVKLYSNNCPMCEVLKRKFQEKGISYDLIEINEQDAIMRGFKSMPMVEMNEKLYRFSEVIINLNMFKGGN